MHTGMNTQVTSGEEVCVCVCIHLLIGLNSAELLNSLNLFIKKKKNFFKKKHKTKSQFEVIVQKSVRKGLYWLRYSDIHHRLIGKCNCAAETYNYSWLQ